MTADGFTRLDPLIAGLDPLVDPAEEARLVAVRSELASALARGNRVEGVQHHTAATATITVWRGTGAGTASATCSTASELAALVADARAIAFADAAPPTAVGDDELDDIDPQLATISGGDLAANLGGLLAAAIAICPDAVVEIAKLTTETQRSARRVARRGAARGQGGRLSWSLSLMRRGPHAASSLIEITGCDDRWSRGIGRLTAAVTEVARRFAACGDAVAIDRLDRPRLFLTPTAVADLVVPYLVHHLGSGSQLTGASALPLGATATCEILTVRDLPHRPESFRACRRDRDGTPTQEVVLLDRGRAQTAIGDRRAAHALGLAPPGLAGGPFGLAIDAGATDEARLVYDVGPIVHLGSFTGELDAASGRFAGIAKGAWLERAGEPPTLVDDFAVRGDVAELLADVRHLGARRDWVRGECLCPGLLVERGIEIAASPARSSSP